MHEDALRRFEATVRRTPAFTESRGVAKCTHPFDVRGIHEKLPSVVKELFDDGHYAQATFEAFKFVDNEVQRHSLSQESGYKLMMKVFAPEAPAIALTAMSSTTEKDEQRGFQYLFAGSALAIRNPRGHACGLKDDPDLCLDHLSLASMLLRRLEEAGYK